MRRLALTVLWPAFLMAVVLEGLIFTLVDPTSLHWFGGSPVALSSSAIYTVSFLIFWALIGISGAMTALLLRSGAEVNAG